MVWVMFCSADDIERPWPMQYQARPVQPNSGYLRPTLLATLLALTACSTGIADTRPLLARHAGAGDAIGCQRLGEIGVATWFSYGFILRDAYDTEQALATLARQTTTAMGGNLSIPLNAVKDGRQRYAVYRCPSTQWQSDEQGRE